jgi:hypothetical protein
MKSRTCLSTRCTLHGAVRTDIALRHVSPGKNRKMVAFGRNLIALVAVSLCLTSGILHAQTLPTPSTAFAHIDNATEAFVGDWFCAYVSPDERYGDGCINGGKTAPVDGTALPSGMGKFVAGGDAAGGWHCEWVDSDGVGHDCTWIKDESANDGDGRAKYGRGLDFVSPEGAVKDWHCEWVDSDGVGHDCTWVDVIVVDG